MGVTCEIYSVKESEEYGVDQLSIKAEGRQRFKILSKEMQMDGLVLSLNVFISYVFALYRLVLFLS